MSDPFQGSLFSSDLLRGSITALPDWGALDDGALASLRDDLRALFDRFPARTGPNESQTEDDLIWPILTRLGWSDSLRQQNLAPKGREDVPDGLLFPNAEAKATANGFAEEWRRYDFGLVVVESKRWGRPLDRRSGRRGEETAPSTQMLRYLRRVDDLTSGKLRWGVLTNGARWRLYYQGARSVSEQFLDLDLAAILDLPGHNEGLFALSPDARMHWLKVFALVFGRAAFLPNPSDDRTFHQRALDEGRFHEERVAANLSAVVFEQVFPGLAKALADAAPTAPLPEVRDATLVLLYRLLFILYAEDRNLLPVRDTRYDDYGLRDKVRGDVGARKDRADTFSTTQGRYWAAIQDLSRAINLGDASIGLPPYNGGLFDPDRTPMLEVVRLSDAIMADVIDALSFEVTPHGRRYINYRDLSVQQLGSIYERLLEHDLVRDDGDLRVRPNVFARKGSGSYYTPDDLVRLIIRETVGPLVDRRRATFDHQVEALSGADLSDNRRIGKLKLLDPAESLLEVKICDPAMGSGHFLVSLVDYLTDQVIEAMAAAEASVWYGDYVSPLAERIERIRLRIQANAEANGWAVDEDQLDDRHIVRRMVLKRCVYGVDKTPMAVELAKVSLWLHTFTVGAPLSFLDHHLRHGDSLFGLWVSDGFHKAGMMLNAPLRQAMVTASAMQMIEGLTDAEIAEAHHSANIFEDIKDRTGPLNALLSLLHAFDWLNAGDRADRAAVFAFLDGKLGDPVAIAMGTGEPVSGHPESERFAALLAQARTLIDEERFLHWQVAFPGVWSDWARRDPVGGFDAVIGNPPWDRMKLQQVEWFAARKPDIAMAQRAADRRRMIAALETAGDPLADDYARARSRAEAATRVARQGGAYPLLSRGDVNLYSLFVERAMSLVKPDGMVGLLTPSGIASDMTAAAFFKGVATEGRLKALYDFENRRTRYGLPPWFPDVDSRFKFCVFVSSPSPTPESARCAFFVQDVAELDDPQRCFALSAEDFARVNPNTGTAPIFRSRRDADLTTAVYGRLPVLVDRSSGGAERRAWPVRYVRMFDMTNDSGLFRTRVELEENEGAYPLGGNRFGSPSGEWVPLYEGKMVQAFDHRAASIVVNPDNRHRPAQPRAATAAEHADPTWVPEPQYWVPAHECGWTPGMSWVVGFKEITAATNVRTFIASVLPTVGFGNKIPILMPTSQDRMEWALASNLNSIVFDFIIRQKIQGQTLNLFIVEQLPVVPPEHYDTVRFGPKTAGEIVREAVLELTYTAHDMAPFARDMGHVDAGGAVRPPFVWDEGRRLRLRAKLDAVFFHLYGVTDRDDVRHIYSTFPIVERD